MIQLHFNLIDTILINNIPIKQLHFLSILQIFFIIELMIQLHFNLIDTILINNIPLKQLHFLSILQTFLLFN